MSNVHALSRGAMQRLREVTSRDPRQGASRIAANPSRRVCFVKVTNGLADGNGMYECVARDFLTVTHRAGGDTWEEYDAGLVYPAAGVTLELDGEYLAVEAAPTESGTPCFCATNFAYGYASYLVSGIVSDTDQYLGAGYKAVDMLLLPGEVGIPAGARVEVDAKRQGVTSGPAYLYVTGYTAADAQEFSLTVGHVSPGANNYSYMVLNNEEEGSGYGFEALAGPGQSSLSLSGTAGVIGMQANTAPNPYFIIDSMPGQSGTDALGNVFLGGICTSVATSGTLDGGSIDTGTLPLDAIEDITANRLLGRYSIAGPPQEISLNSTLEFTAGPTLGLADGAVTAAKLGASAVETAKINDLAVTTAKVADGAITYAKIQDVSATSRVLGRRTAGSGDAEECTLSQVLDFIGSAAQGDILYRGASAWARLAASTAGQALLTQGPGANPQWGSVSGVATGIVAGFATVTAPTGWLACDGSAVSRTTYADLFALLGTTYGVGDGSTTFNVPDYRDRFLVGSGSGSSYTITATGGSSTVTLTTAQLSPHAHAQAAATLLNTGAGALASGAAVVASLGGTTGSAGSGSSHENKPPYHGILWCIKT